MKGHEEELLQFNNKIDTFLVSMKINEKDTKYIQSLEKSIKEQYDDVVHFYKANDVQLKNHVKKTIGHICVY